MHYTSSQFIQILLLFNIQTMIRNQASPSPRKNSSSNGAVNQSKNEIQHKIRQIINSERNVDKIGSIVDKMSRLLAKKQQLIHQQPQQVYSIGQKMIWIGNYSFANNRQFLQANNITLVISCLEVKLSLYLENVQYKRIPIKDKQSDKFIKYCQEVYHLLQSAKGNAFIHCFKGQSRSPAFLIYYIMRKQKIAYAQAYQKLHSVYPKAQPHPQFITLLKQQQSKLLSQNLIQVFSSSHSYQSSKQYPSSSVTENLIQLQHSNPTLNLLELGQYINVVQKSTPTSPKNMLMDLIGHQTETVRQDIDFQQLKISSQILQTPIAIPEIDNQKLQIASPQNQIMQLNLAEGIINPNKSQNLINLEYHQDSIAHEILINIEQKDKAIQLINTQANSSLIDNLIQISTTPLTNTQNQGLDNIILSEIQAEACIELKEQTLVKQFNQQTKVQEPLISVFEEKQQFKEQKLTQATVNHPQSEDNKEQQFADNADFTQKKKKNKKKKK